MSRRRATGPGLPFAAEEDAAHPEPDREERAPMIGIERARAEERARALYDACAKTCTCSAPDCGVGVIHERYCGVPTMEDIADAIRAAILAETERCVQVAKAMGWAGDALRHGPPAPG